ncbi:MAG: NUDIX domain-containing protein [Clostridiales bacterium]|nr:NUDIX domain-containing protein [Clostridiales bacterium]
MLGKYAKVKVTRPIKSFHPKYGFEYELNYGFVEGVTNISGTKQGAYIMGIDHPVREFDGRIIAIIKRNNMKGVEWVVAPKSKKFIVNDIKKAIDFAESYYGYSLECLYEHSCGAVVFKEIDGERKFLLIKNKRSAHWGFPKGHIEEGETQKETAFREVLEETGLHIRFIPDFISKSEYTIQGKVEKCVNIFLATTDDDEIIMQEEEIEAYIWLNYEQAMETLKFDNDKNILKNAQNFLKGKENF